MTIAPTTADEPQVRVPLLSDDDAWERLPPIEVGRRQPLPTWARALADSLPRTTAAMLELDCRHRTKNPLGNAFAARLRWTVAKANHCDYWMACAEADLRRAGGDDETIAALKGDWSQLPEVERNALALARDLTVDGGAVSDEQVERVRKSFGDERLVALVLLVAHANFQDRLSLALGIGAGNGALAAPLDVRFATGEAAGEIAVPPREPPPEGMPPEAPERVDDPEWRALDFDFLQQKLESQRFRGGRIRVPAWEEVLPKLPESRRPKHPLRIRWSLVCAGYQPQLALGWSACTRAFAEEAKQDRVFEESVFWIVTRTIHCFY